MEILLLVFGFLVGYSVSMIQWYYPEKRKSRLSSTLAQMQKVLLEKAESDLRWAKAKIGVQQVDLDRMNQKLTQRWEPPDSALQAPQWNMSYWRIEGPKLQKRVLDLEMQLEECRSKTVWKDQ